MCQATSFFLVPGKRRQGSSENWDWRSQARPILQNLTVSRWEWCVYYPCANKIAREAMNPAITLVDAASANREGLKAFLQNQKCHVDTVADGVSVVRCCLEMQ